MVGGMKDKESEIEIVLLGASGEGAAVFREAEAAFYAAIAKSLAWIVGSQSAELPAPTAAAAVALTPLRQR
jgi:hypothetical protein